MAALESIPGPPWSPDDEVSTEELLRRQGIGPFALRDMPWNDPFGSDEEYAEFLADLYRSRRMG